MEDVKKISSSVLFRQIQPYFDILQKTVHGYLFVADMKEGLVLLSDSFTRDFDLPGTLLEEMEPHWIPLIHPDDRERYLESIRDVFHDRTTVEHDMEYRVLYRTGEYGWINCHGILGCDGDGQPALWAGIITPLDHVVHADTVTRLLNRYVLESVLAQELQHPDASGVVMVIGLDNFQIINETYGHQFGDAAMHQIAQNIANLLPPDVRLYKMDGDQFGILWKDMIPEETEIFFSSIQLALREVGGVTDKIYCTASGGAAFYPKDGTDSDTLLKHAQAAMTMAKQQGRDRICFFSQEVYDKWCYDISMETLMKNCIARGCEDFFLYYQPQIVAENQKLMGAEALLRWKDDDGTILAPMQFIPILEKTRMIIPVGHWIIDQALATCKEWQKYQPDFQMSVNISLYQLEEHTFYPFVKECIERHGVDPSTITFELTETQNVTDWDFVNRQFAAFHGLGIRIAMDDFGTGYASLGFLKNFNCNTIKIDRVFVQDILESDFDRNLVKYVIMLCHSIGMDVCIEGVEDEESFVFLRDVCNADIIQGFLFGHPEPKEVFERRFHHLS